MKSTKKTDTDNNSLITERQCRAARGLLGLSQKELAEAAGVSLSAIRDFETGTRQPRRATMVVIRQALEDAGVELIQPNGGGAGVRMRDPEAR